MEGNRLKKFLKVLGGARVKGGVIATVGYILSPLSWWNDLFVNIPIAYVVASIISIFSREFFVSAFIGSYLATNIIGLVMMHIGVEGVVKGSSRISRETVLKYILVSTVYTILVSILALTNIIEPPY